MLILPVQPLVFIHRNIQLTVSSEANVKSVPFSDIDFFAHCYSTHNNCSNCQQLRIELQQTIDHARAHAKTKPSLMENLNLLFPQLDVLIDRLEGTTEQGVNTPCANCMMPRYVR